MQYIQLLDFNLDYNIKTKTIESILTESVLNSDYKT
jgi:hypothetical protein